MKASDAETARRRKRFRMDRKPSDGSETLFLFRRLCRGKRRFGFFLRRLHRSRSSLFRGSGSRFPCLFRGSCGILTGHSRRLCNGSFLRNQGLGSGLVTSQHSKGKSQNKEEGQENNRQLGKLSHCLGAEDTFSDASECGTESAAFGRLDKH